MDALNFLSQKPALNWFDFYLEPELLIPHLEQKKPEPNEDHLIAQFCEQAKLEEQQASASDIPRDEVDYHSKKANTLWCMALKVCAHLNWNLTSLRKKSHVVHMKCLMHELCRLIVGTADLVTVLCMESECCPIPQPEPSAALILSTKVLCARWILDATRADAFPTPPPKITVSNPSAQVDPSLPLLEGKRAAVHELKSYINFAVELLKDVISKGDFHGEQYLLPSPSCFVIRKGSNQETSHLVQFDWNSALSLSSKLAYAQCLYDLTEHSFFTRKYAATKEYLTILWKETQQVTFPVHQHFTLDREAIMGYCRALKLDHGQVQEDSKEDDGGYPKKSKMMKRVEEEATLNQRSLPQYAQLHSVGLLSGIDELLAITEGNVQFLRRPENASTFCLTLKERLSEFMRSCRTRTIIIAYLKFLCSLHPPLLETLKGCGVLDGLQESEASLRRYTISSWNETETAVDLTLLSKLEPPWRVLHTSDSAELKSAASRTQPNRVSSHFYVPVSVQPVLLKLPTGIYQDLVALAACKAQQLTEIGAMSSVPALLDLASQQARSGLGEVAPELSWELVRLELIRWHNLLHRCADVQRMSQMTMELANKVKSFIATGGHKGAAAASAHWELPMLVSSFLLNTCDWEFIILHCPSFHRFADFSKVLAGLCYEVSKGSVNVRNVAREFFDIMLPTMLDAVQYKRSVGGAQSSMHREPQLQLLTRSYFTAIVKNLKEPCAVSLLISFLVKLYNGLKGGIVEIFAEHLNLWPATFVDSGGVNENYLKEIFQIALENALLVNPNNAFWLRARGDFELANDHLHTALQYYLQCLLSCSDAFTKPFPANVVDDRLIMNMVKCCGRLDCHTQEALLCQLLSEPNYGLAVKALQEMSNYDSANSYYAMIWDPALLELLIHVLDKSNQQQARLQLALRMYSQQDSNIHNDESILNAVTARRRKMFLTSMCRMFL